VKRRLHDAQLGKVFGAGTFRYRGEWRVPVVQRLSTGRAPRGCFSLRTIALCDGRVEGVEELESPLDPSAPRGRPASSAAQARAMRDAVEIVLAAECTCCSGPVPAVRAIGEGDRRPCRSNAMSRGMTLAALVLLMPACGGAIAGEPGEHGSPGMSGPDDVEPCLLTGQYWVTTVSPGAPHGRAYVRERIAFQDVTCVAGESAVCSEDGVCLLTVCESGVPSPSCVTTGEDPSNGWRVTLDLIADSPR
jgi:hypothetical protein